MGSGLRRNGLSQLREILLLLFSVLLGTRDAWAAPNEVSVSAFRAQVSLAERLVADCTARASACSGRTLPGDEQVGGEASRAGFHASWGWLQETLDAAAKAPAPERTRAMLAAGDRLTEIAGEVSGNDVSEGASFAAAHAAAARVLAREEFRADAAPTWLDRQIGRLQDWFLRLFVGLGLVGARNPWLGPLIEWLCFGLAAAGLLFFVRRSLQRQSLRLSLEEGVAIATRKTLHSTDWTRRAEAAEAAGDWREAIHCLYWGAIAALETQRAWRPNPTRTPREYVRLLRPGSEAQRALGALTRRFERTWYGSALPTRAEAQAAKLETTAIQANDPSRRPTPETPAAATGATG